MKKMLNGLIAVLVLCGTSWAGGTILEDPKVDYSADSHIEVEGMVMDGKVYYSPGKERREMNIAGNDSIMIVRKDKNIMWTLMTMQSMYQERGLDKNEDMVKNAEEKVGEEVIDGIQTTKYKLIMTQPNGDKFGGFIWLTKEGIPLKIDAISKSGDSKSRVKVELKNLKVEKQDPRLFEIPEGYSRFSMKPFGGGGFNMNEMMKMKERMKK